MRKTLPVHRIILLTNAMLVDLQGKVFSLLDLANHFRIGKVDLGPLQWNSLKIRFRVTFRGLAGILSKGVAPGDTPKRKRH